MKRIRKFAGGVGIALSLLLFVGTIFNALGAQGIGEPSNPIEDLSRDSSHVLLASTLDRAYEMTDYLADNSEDEQSKDESGDEENENTETESEQSNREASNGQDAGDGKNKGNPQGKGDSLDGELIDSEDVDNKNEEYFTTTIVQNETVTVPEYSFQIIHLNDELEVVSTNVYINQNHVPQFGGSVYLREGSNSIRVEVNYKNKEGEDINVFKNYTVHLNIEDIIIYTNLEDNQKVHEPDFSFRAYAERAGEDVPITVTLNDKAVKSSSDKGQYDISLTKGNNEIVISATDGEKSAKEEYTVNYEKLEIETDLKDQEVISSTFSFYARAKNPSATLDILLNGEKVSDEGNGNYSVSLNEGKNIIKFLAQIGTAQIEKEYKITYTKSVPGGPDSREESNENAPTFRVDGLKRNVKNETLNFQVVAHDYKGNALGASAIQIITDAKNKFLWSNAGQVSYQLTLNEGDNAVSVRVTDAEGNWSQENYTVHYEVPKESIGTFTLSIEATTVGLGYLIEPTEVEIFSGENYARALDRVLTDNGFEYDNTGSFDNSFYLEGIIKEGLVANPVIPSDLLVLLEEDALENRPIEHTVIDENFLGEFDFTHGSGWMYQVNGIYPNYGFSDCYLQDGDEVRMRFTLMYGADIGGYGAMGREDEGGIDAERYYKEW